MKKIRKLFSSQKKEEPTTAQASEPSQPEAGVEVHEAPEVEAPAAEVFEPFLKAKNRIRECQARSMDHRSAIFYTAHKCASSFVTGLLDELDRQSSYEVMNYPSAYWELGDEVDTANIKNGAFQRLHYDMLFRTYGEIYGPLRVPLDFPGRENFKHIFFLRDPRDALVSFFYSRAYTHPLPPHSKVRENFLKKRERALEEGIDAMVLREAENWIVPLYTKYHEMAQNAPDALMLKYDEYASQTEVFLKRVTDYLDIELGSESMERLLQLASPIREGAPELTHQRSGKSGQWQHELKPETAEALNHKLQTVLEDWEFVDPKN